MTDTMTALPPIRVTREDHHALSMLAGSVAEAPAGALFLREELERAEIVEEPLGGDRFARLGSSVTFEDGGSGRVRTVTLVLPEGADIDQGRVSVFSPIGAALLGLAEGATIPLRGDGLIKRALRVLAIQDS